MCKSFCPLPSQTYTALQKSNLEQIQASHTSVFYRFVKHCFLPFFASPGWYRVIYVSLLSCFHFLEEMAETQPTRVLILGHSFIHRLKSFLASRYSLSFLRNLQLSKNLHIRWQGIGGRTVFFFFFFENSNLILFTTSTLTLLTVLILYINLHIQNTC